MITIPEPIAKQLPHTRYRHLEHLYREFDGIPLPPSSEALTQALELVEACIASPVFTAVDKVEFHDFKDALLEHADGE